TAGVHWIAACAQATRRALDCKVDLAVMPTPEFNPLDVTVGRFISQVVQLSQVARPALSAARAVTVQLLSIGEGEAVYGLQVPEAASPQLERALGTYSGIEVASLDEVRADKEEEAREF